MALVDGRGVDVGDEFPAIVDSSFYRGVYDGYLSSGSSNGLSEWTSSATPDVTDCASQLRTHPIEQLQLRVGLRFCTRATWNNRVAYVNVTSYEGPSSNAEIDVTIWDLPE